MPNDVEAKTRPQGAGTGEGVIAPPPESAASAAVEENTATAPAAGTASEQALVETEETAASLGSILDESASAGDDTPEPGVERAIDEALATSEELRAEVDRAARTDDPTVGAPQPAIGSADSTSGAGPSASGSVEPLSEESLAKDTDAAAMNHVEAMSGPDGEGTGAPRTTPVPVPAGTNSPGELGETASASAAGAEAMSEAAEGAADAAESAEFADASEILNTANAARGSRSTSASVAALDATMAADAAKQLARDEPTLSTGAESVAAAPANPPGARERGAAPSVPAAGSAPPSGSARAVSEARSSEETTGAIKPAPSIWRRSFKPTMARAAGRAGTLAARALMPVASRYQSVSPQVRKAISIIAVGTGIQAATIWGYLLFFRTGGGEAEALAAMTSGPIKPTPGARESGSHDAGHTGPGAEAGTPSHGDALGNHELGADVVHASAGVSDSPTGLETGGQAPSGHAERAEHGGASGHDAPADH
ncbi:MAG: hypothetical protein AB7G11_12745 [Phycisphaerales bacterium]